MDDDGGLAGRLRARMEERGITQSELADRVHASQAAVSQWVGGRKRPNRANIQELARALDVTQEWLQLGINGPAPDLEQQQAEYVGKTAWRLRPTPSDGGRDFGNANIWALAPTIETLGRESAQNTVDERLGATVGLTYRLIVLKGDAKADFLTALKMNQLRPHLEASTNSRQKLAQFIREGLSLLDSQKELLLLRIEDRGASGLTGEEFGDSEDHAGRFMALCRNNLDSEKDSKAAGAFGLGKAVLWRASQLSTVLFHSNLSAPTADGWQSNRIIGRVELPWHKIGNDSFAGPGWFGMLDEGRECAVSMWNNQKLAADLYMERENPAPGTSILVIGFQDPSGEVDQPTQLARQLELTLAKNFWPAIVSKKLSVSIEIAEGRDSIVHSVSVDPSTAVPQFVDAVNHWRTNDLNDALVEPGDVVMRRIPLNIPKRTARDDGHGPMKHEAILLVRYADEDDENAGEVVFYRGAEMVVIRERWKGIRVGAKPFHAIVMCGGAAGSDAASVAAERFLRTAEPPAHNNWSPTQELRGAYAAGYRKGIVDFIDAVKTAIGEAVAPDTKDLVDGPRAIRELLRLGPVVDPATARPRVMAEATVDQEGRWVVEGTVRVVRPDTIKDGVPTVVFRAETGGGQSVKWESLEAVKGCTVVKGRLVIGKGAREARFRGVTDVRDHPIPARESTITVDFRDVHELVGAK